MLISRWRLLPGCLQLRLGLPASQQPPETFSSSCTSSGRRQFHGSPPIRSKKDEPYPFLNTAAHKFKVRDMYQVSEKEARRGRYGLPLGLFFFSILVYFGWIREYGETDKAIVDFLTRDISDKIPPQKLNQIKKAIEEEKEMSSNDRLKPASAKAQ